eukprot:TRINITY_DN2732_c0_g2_i1.p1 TRINITY_DN2732_c0_g2~~TRINITY_DN2732_c0_g2_i1.p1  ORF type:complete len:560 (-),score=70.47 TRINITY_DN2732_c0_g2_i1:786-2465(-)
MANTGSRPAPGCEARSLILIPALLAVLVMVLPLYVHSLAPQEPVDAVTGSVALMIDVESQGNGAVENGPIHSSLFPKNFVFGTATSAYQVEGAVHEGGRSASVWDTFSHTAGKISDGSNGDVAVDQYHLFKEDVDRLASMGMKAYRFSIAWARIYPNNSGTLNEEGVAYYDRLIDYLRSKDLEPYVTLYHWDLPQYLHDSVEGWLGRDIVDYWAAYAEACFEAFGDRVKNWITFNEPVQFTVGGYGTGAHPPGRTSDRKLSPVGDSATEPYIAGHNVLRSHAIAVDIYRRKFQSKQGGVIGITCDAEWAEPMTNSSADKAAAETHVLFQLGWYLDPIFLGDYPEVMRKQVGDRLPTFTAEEKDLLRGSVDFVGINHYTSRWVSAGSAHLTAGLGGYWEDQWNVISAEQDGIPIGDRAASEWLYIVPWGIQKTLTWVSRRYNGPPILVTENGMDDLNDPLVSLAEALQDTKRVKFYQDYLSYVLAAIRDGVDVRAYFAWSLVDNFEWQCGYTRRFGLYFVDYNDNLKRYPKSSVEWFTKFMKCSGVSSVSQEANSRYQKS